MSDKFLYSATDLIGGRHKCAFLQIPKIEISNSQVHFVIGRNGSGKTTLLETIAGVIPDFSGRVQRTTKCGYMPSATSVQDGVTGHDLYDLLGIKNSKWKSDRVVKAFDVDSLLRRALVDLSSGERQRVILSAVLQHNSDLVVLDEPLNHLDWKYLDLLPRQILDSCRNGRAFVIAVHDLNWTTKFLGASALCLEKGQVISSGLAEDVLTHPKVQDCFYFRSVFIDNPIDGTKILATAAKD